MAQDKKHIPVLLTEVINLLQPQSNQTYIDATIGLGGHARAILERTGPQGVLIGFDRDETALRQAQNNLKVFGSRVIYIHDSYSKIKTKINEHSFDKVNGIVCDLGYSSVQVESGERGFSFLDTESLDLRYDRESGITADELLHTASEKELTDILRDYGEETLAYRIAQAICQTRKKTKITGLRLKEIVERVYGSHYRKPSRIHPATKTWQALRIAVNHELDELQVFLPQAVACLQSGGRLAVISFHSLEDRLVKRFFQTESRDCICPKEVPYCVCKHVHSINVLTKKPIVPQEDEVRENPRSRSAKLRVIKKI